jgi:transposase
MARATQLKKPKRRRIVGGVDTHADTHHAAVLLMHGGRVADAEFPATAAGHAQLLAWLRGFGRLHAVGVEGTGSYGAGLARHLHAAGVRVVEVSRPDRRQRRLAGKSDPLDAYAAAEAVLAGRATALPKLGTGIVEAIRALHLTRASAVKARTVAINELRALLVTAPAGLRDQLRELSTTALVDTCARLRPASDRLADPEQATKQALRRLAGRYRALSEEITDLDGQLRTLVTRACPALPATFGVGVETAAQLLITIGDNPDRIRSEAAFAALCGVAPVPASSGKTRNKHRLSRGGDRQANRALYMITITRLHRCPRTRAYATRRTAEGLSTKDIIRCLKRYLAREIYKTLTSTNTPTKDLEPAA